MAHALAVGGGSTADFIKAIGGEIQGSEFRRVSVRLRNASFPRAEVALDRSAPMGGEPSRWPPESVTLEADTSAAPVPLTALAAQFGAWTRGVPGPDGVDIWNVRFDAPVRPAVSPGGGPRAAGGPAGHSVRVTAVLTDDPERATARVLQVTLFRDD